MIDLVVLAVLALAAFRITRLVVVDTIFDGLRSKTHVFFHNQAAKEGKLALFWEKLLELSSCTWCSGVWVSFLLYTLYVWQNPLDFGRFDLINIAALAGAQGFLHSLEPADD